jgi:IS605 OrfB family transposase
VKLKINRSSMSEYDMRRLNQMLYRDTRIIKSYINIINENEKSIEKGNKINKSELDKLTAFTKDRPHVKHDLKSKYPRISLNELKECRDTAIGMYNGYLAFLKNGEDASVPSIEGLIPRSIGYNRFTLDTDNSVVSIMDSMDTNPKMIRDGKTYTKHDKLDIPIILSKYALDKFSEGTVKAIKIFYQNNELYMTISVKVDVDQISKRPLKTSIHKPVGVLGVDLGIKIAASTSLITPKGISAVKDFRVSDEISHSYLKVDNRVRQLQRISTVRLVDELQENFEIKISKLSMITSMNLDRTRTGLTHLNDLIKDISDSNLNAISIHNDRLYNELKSIKGNLSTDLKKLQSKNNKNKSNKTQISEYYKEIKILNNLLHSLSLINKLENNWDKSADGTLRKLRELRNTRHNLKLEIDRLLILQISEYIEELSQKYDIYVSLGKLKGIRRNNQRGNGNKAHRKRIHKWSFFRFTSMLENKMSLLGFSRRFLVVNEAWTSKTCWKCNTIGTRPKQSHFICNNCGWQGNADMNGAINIAKRLIKNFRLTQFSKIGKKGLGKYLPVTPSKIRKGNGKVRYRPNARKRSPAPKGQPGTNSLNEWFQHDLSVSAENLSSEKLGNREAGHSNRPEITEGQHTRQTKEVTPKVTVTSG